jgi:hypothetical protein
MAIAERWASYPNSPDLLIVSLIIFGVASQNLIRLEFFRKSRPRIGLSGVANVVPTDGCPGAKIGFEKRQVGSMR